MRPERTAAEPESLSPQIAQPSEVAGSGQVAPQHCLPGGDPQSAFPQRSSRVGMIRLVAALIAMIPLSGLGLARTLSPNASGLGTHQQLGLPPCSMRLLFGIRCPGCGMTTSWAHFMRGNWRESAAISLGGFLFAIFAIWIAYLGLRTAWTAQLPSTQTQQFIAFSAAGIFVVALLQWIQRLWG